MNFSFFFAICAIICKLDFRECRIKVNFLYLFHNFLCLFNFKITKNLNSGNVISQHIPNDHKGAVFQNETTSISSPARRSEISPIQNHVS